MHPLVSILIPAYNSEKWIKATIQSALNQTYKNKEIIFNGNSIIETNNNILKSDKISWQDNSKKFIVSGMYELIKQGSVQRGKSLKTDFLLSEIEFCDNKT